MEHVNPDKAGGSAEKRVHFGKDPASALTHFVGLLFAIAGLVALSALSVGDGPKLAVMTIYGLTLVAVFLSSTCYHFFDLGESGNRWLRRLDHCAIFLLIGGTYAPAVLHLTDGTGRLFLLGLVAALALTGTMFKLVWVECPDKLSTMLYLGFGWMCIVPGYWMFPQLSLSAMSWLAIGGLAYTGGAIIYVRERPDPWPGVFGHHEVWHLCVLAGAAAHFMFTLGFLDQSYPPF